MSTRIWHKGPPPHVGWWNAHTTADDHLWRWWDGSRWSVAARDSASVLAAAIAAGMPSERNPDAISWTSYWPENARATLIYPSEPEAPADLALDALIAARRRIQTDSDSFVEANTSFHGLDADATPAAREYDRLLLKIDRAIAALTTTQNR